MAKVFDHSTHDKLPNVVLRNFGGHYISGSGLTEYPFSKILDGKTDIRHSWVSQVGGTNENRFDKKGVELAFTKIVKLQSFEIVTMSDGTIFKDAYKKVCFYTDGSLIGCTADDFVPAPGSTINFVDKFATMDLVGKSFSLLFKDTGLKQFAQIAEFKASFFEQG